MMCLPINKTKPCLTCVCLCVVRCEMNLERKREDTEDLLGVWCRRSKGKHHGLIPNRKYGDGFIRKKVTPLWRWLIEWVEVRREGVLFLSRYSVRAIRWDMWDWNTGNWHWGREITHSLFGNGLACVRRPAKWVRLESKKSEVPVVTTQ